MAFSVDPDELGHPDHHVRDTAVGQLERESRGRHGDLGPFRGGILGLLDPDELWTTRLHLARLLGRLDCAGPEHDRRLKYLFEQAGGPNKFVAAWALDSLSILAMEDRSIRDRVWQVVRQGLESRSAAVRARARRVAERMQE